MSNQQLFVRDLVVYRCSKSLCVYVLCPSVMYCFFVSGTLCGVLFDLVTFKPGTIGPSCIAVLQHPFQVICAHSRNEWCRYQSDFAFHAAWSVHLPHCMCMHTHMAMPWTPMSHPPIQSIHRCSGLLLLIAHDCGRPSSWIQVSFSGECNFGGAPPLPREEVTAIAPPY